MKRRNLLSIFGSGISFGTIIGYSSTRQSAIAADISIQNLKLPKNKTDNRLQFEWGKFDITTTQIKTTEENPIIIRLNITNDKNEEIKTEEWEFVLENENNMNKPIEDVSKSGELNPVIFDSVSELIDEEIEKDKEIELKFEITIIHSDIENVNLSQNNIIKIIESDLQIDNFESYNLNEFPSSYIIEDDSVNDNMYIDDTHSLSGENALRFGATGSGSHDFGEIDNEFKTFMAGEYTSRKPSQITMSYYETNDSNGQWVRWMKDNKELCSVGTTNAELEIVTGDGEQRLASNSDIEPDYGEWRTYTITIDWENKKLDLLWEDIGGSTTSIEKNNLLFKNENINEINRIEFGRDQRVNDNGSGYMDCWYDNISFKPD